MKILQDSNLLQELSNSFLFLDTTALITAIKYPDSFGSFINSLHLHGSAILTIPSVFFEFVRGSDNIETYNTRARFLERLTDIYPIEKHLPEMQSDIVTIQKIGNHMSYTDFLLGMCLCKFPDAYLLTENHSDFHNSLFTRQSIITLDDGKEIHNHGVYQISKNNLEKARTAILAV